MTESMPKATLRFEHVHLSVQSGGSDHSGRRGHAPRGLLHDIHFSLAPGKMLGIVGESGAGKSTVGRLVAGLLPDGFALTKGRIWLGEQELTAMSTRQRQSLLGRRLAFIPQEPLTALNPLMTIGQSFSEQLDIAGLPRSDHAAHMQAALAAMQLPDPQALVKRHPHQLSGGQCQRVLIAMAFAAQPELIVADEPTTALDVMTQARVMRLLMQQQKAHGTSVMLITHDLLMAAHVCDDIIVLHAGDIVERGVAVDVLTQPQHAYTQMLVAAIPRLSDAPIPNAPPAPPLPQPQPPVSKTALLSVRNLNLSYPAPDGWPGLRLPFMRRRQPAAAALRDVSFDVYPGECVGIVGESGSGKSSLARVLMGMHTGTHEDCKGSMVLDGVPVLGPKPTTAQAAQAATHIRSRAQIIFQDPHSALNPRRSVRRLLTQGGEALPRKERPALAPRLHALLDSIGLPAQLLTRYPAQLSGGQKQRVNIGRGLFLAPKLLLADEIVSGLDMTVQAQILRLLNNLAQQQGIAIVLISHDLAVVRQLCQRVIVMRQGQVVEQGPVAQVFARPSHDYTRRLLAAVPGGNPQTQAWPPEFKEG